MPISSKKLFDCTFTIIQEDFKKANGIDFVTIVYCVASMCVAYYMKFVVDKITNFLTIMSRGYEGPLDMADIVNEIFECRFITEKFLNYKFDVDKGKIDAACQFLTLADNSKVNYYNYSSIKLFARAFGNRYYIDYSTILLIFSNLFNSIDLNKHNFRGKALEDAIGIPSFLPTKPCKSLLGTYKQIDFSVLIDEVLIIAECKVVARKKAYFAGSISSINHRKLKVVEGLSE